MTNGWVDATVEEAKYWTGPTDSYEIAVFPMIKRRQHMKGILGT